MPIDPQALRARQQAAQAANNNGGNWFSMKEPGHYLVYVCPQSADLKTLNPDGAPFVGPVHIHYKVGTGDKKMMHLCLDQNPWLWTPEFAAALEATNEKRRADGKAEWVVDLPARPGECPTCAEMANLDTSFTVEALDDMKAQETWALNVVPWAKENADRSVREDVPAAARAVNLFLAKSSLILTPPKGQRALVDFLIESGDQSLSDPKAATLVVFSRTGTDWKSTRYSTGLDIATTRAPMKLDKHMQALLADCEPGGPHNLLGALARMLRSPKAIAQALRPTTTTVPTTPTTPAVETPPSCFKRHCDPDDTECGQCKFKVDCAAACGTRVPGTAAAPSQPRKITASAQAAAAAFDAAAASLAPSAAPSDPPAAGPAPGRPANPSRAASRPAPSAPRSAPPTGDHETPAEQEPVQTRPAAKAPPMTPAPPVRSTVPADDFGEEFGDEETDALADELEAAMKGK